MNIQPGNRYGKLTVLYYDKDHSRWLCHCDCGNESLRSIQSLKSPVPQCKKCILKSLSCHTWKIRHNHEK